MKPQWEELIRSQARDGRPDIPLDPRTLPVKEIARAIAERADELGLKWHLVPATVGQPGPNGTMRVVVDADTEPIDATSMIGRLAVGARVFCILSPPAGVHIVGFLGADFPPAVSGEAIGRPRLIELAANWDTGANNTTPTAVTTMSFPVVANGRYIVRLRASNGGSTAGDTKFGWTGPTGTLMDRYELSIPVGENTNFNPTTWSSARRAIGDNQGNANTPNAAPSTAFPGYWEDILVRVGSTGGTVQLMAAQVTASATPSFVLANSYMEVQRYR